LFERSREINLDAISYNLSAKLWFKTPNKSKFFNMNQTKTRFSELDVFRGIAALSVVIFHYTTSYKSFYQQPTHLFYYFLNYGSYGVELFFMISGFVILMTLEKTQRSLDFIVNRMARLYPTYWTCTAITLILFYLFNISNSKLDKLPTIFERLFNFTMFQELFNIGNINIVYWTLTIELCFYIIMFSLYKAKLLKHIDIIAGIWLFLVFLNSLKAGSEVLNNVNTYLFESDNFNHFLVINPNLTAIKEYIKHNFLLLRGHAHFFITGLMLYREKMYNFAWYRWAIIAGCFVVQILDYSRKDATLLTILFVLFIAMFYAAIKEKINFINVKPLVFLGTISYSLYLVHLNVNWLLNPLMEKINIYPDISIVIMTILSIIVASLITFYIEKPALNFVKNKYKS
jgi:peptidoglycan/LPS O-acetylase OafA/YrhL